MSHIVNHNTTYAIQSPTSNHSGTIDPKFIVMHYTAGFSAQSAINAYENRRVSANITIDIDGTVYQHVPYNKAAWHAGPSRYMGYNGLNKYSIGIEIVNAGWFRKDGQFFYRDNLYKHATDMPKMVQHAYPRVGSGDFWWPEYPEEQLAAVEAITRDILSEYGIIDIVTHEEIDTRGWKTDPGPAFPMERYKRLMFDIPHRDLDSDSYQVTAGVLNVRQGPGTEFSVMDVVKKGDIVQVVDERGSWRRIDLNGNEDGWVHEAYLRRV